jgi:hypothetical protein
LKKGAANQLHGAGWMKKRASSQHHVHSHPEIHKCGNIICLRGNGRQCCVPNSANQGIPGDKRAKDDY